MGDVKKITKEKTAKIIPNAIGVTTVDGKKIFGSLMARDVAYRLACSVWRKYHYPNGGDFVDSIDGERVNIHSKFLHITFGIDNFIISRRMRVRHKMESTQATNPFPNIQPKV